MRCSRTHSCRFQGRSVSTGLRKSLEPVSASAIRHKTRSDQVGSAGRTQGASQVGNIRYLYSEWDVCHLLHVQVLQLRRTSCMRRFGTDLSNQACVSIIQVVQVMSKYTHCTTERQCCSLGRSPDHSVAHDIIDQLGARCPWRAHAVSEA